MAASGQLLGRVLEVKRKQFQDCGSTPADSGTVQKRACFETCLSSAPAFLVIERRSCYSVAKSCPTLGDPVDCSRPGPQNTVFFSSRLKHLTGLQVSKGHETRIRCGPPQLSSAGRLLRKLVLPRPRPHRPSVQRGGQLRDAAASGAQPEPMQLCSATV